MAMIPFLVCAFILVAIDLRISGPPVTAVTSQPGFFTRTFFFFVNTHLLSSFWTSRGHRFRPFSPPVLAFNVYRA